MATFTVILCEDIEKEGLHVVVEGLVVEEKLGQQAQVLAVDCAHISIDLSKGLMRTVVSVRKQKISLVMPFHPLNTILGKSHLLFSIVWNK